MTDNPYIISWNTTKRCNLACSHCYLDSAEMNGASDMSTEQCMKVMDELASFAPGAMLVLTGGEPLLRPDIFSIIRYSRKKGFTPVLGTNATLIDSEVAKELKHSGISGVGISLDSLRGEPHDKIRGVEGSYTTTMNGIEAIKKAGIPFHTQFSITEDNLYEIEGFTRFSRDLGARAVNFFFLVCTGRGQEDTALKPALYEEALQKIVRASNYYKNEIMVRARCAPHIIRYADDSTFDGFNDFSVTSGCIAAKGYLRVDPNGSVTPCPYIAPHDDTPNILNTTLFNIWNTDKAFTDIREGKLEGECGECDFSESCGGCRARSFIKNGTFLGDDPWCEYMSESEIKNRSGNENNKVVISKSAPAKIINITWSTEAEERLKNVPVFVRPLVKKGLERYAKAQGVREITPEMMQKLRSRAKH
ncbi:MAG: radical SAM protein [Deltaproteobacteria bacterium]|nr:radical SAM protein [Deltaproteobacteria bacterium]